MMLSRVLSGMVLIFGVIGAATAKERLDIGGRLMLDGDYYESFWSKKGDASTSEGQLRNARLEIDYDFPRGWLGRLQIDADLDSGGGDVELGSAYFRYTKWRFADITLGKMKEPLGLERSTSADRLLTIERSMLSSAFTPGKSWGVHLYNANKARRWALATVIEDDPNNRYDRDRPVAISGRFNWYPINSDDRTLQLGVSGSIRDWNGNVFRIGERAEVDTADKVVRSAQFRADSLSLVGLEAVWRAKSLLLETEIMWLDAAETHGPDWDYTASYLTVSYFLTGEQHRFRKGKRRTVKPLTASGAWELVARYSYLDARERGLGAITSITTLGVNYYYSKQIRMMLSFLHPDIAGSVFYADSDGNAVSARLQFLF